MDDRSRGSLTLRVTDRLRRAIVEGELELGEPLSEDRLAAALNVSRSPVRHAFAALEQQGLINVQAQRGSSVFLPSREDIFDLCIFRRTIEIEALRLAVKRSRDVTLHALRAAAEAMDASFATGDHRGSARADDAFHDAIISNSGNPYVVSAYRLASGKIAALRSHRSAAPARRQANVEHHRIVALLEADDLAGACEELGTHILGMAERYDIDLPSPRTTAVRAPRGTTFAHIGPLVD